MHTFFFSLTSHLIVSIFSSFKASFNSIVFKLSFVYSHYYLHSQVSQPISCDITLNNYKLVVLHSPSQVSNLFNFFLFMVSCKKTSNIIRNDSIVAEFVTLRLRVIGVLGSLYTIVQAFVAPLAQFALYNQNL